MYNVQVVYCVRDIFDGNIMICIIWTIKYTVLVGFGIYAAEFYIMNFY
jgi:hypothetical protein